MVGPQNIYDDPSFFEGYERLRRSSESLNETLEQPALLSVLPESFEGLRVLDLGCGFGNFARKARELGARSVVGVDISARMLKYAANHTDDPAIEYRQVSIEELGLDEGRFDLIISSLVLHYVEDYRVALRQIASLLAKGGRFAFSVEHPMCTALPQQQWIRDSSGKELFWPIDDYQEEGSRSTNWFVDGVIKYHRTVETYVTGLLQAGLIVRALKEPEPVKGASNHNSVIELHRRRPPFLILAADK